MKYNNNNNNSITTIVKNTVWKNNMANLYLYAFIYINVFGVYVHLCIHICIIYDEKLKLHIGQRYWN